MTEIKNTAKTDYFSEEDPTKVKPCPFCGSVGVEMHDGDTYRWRIVACIECSASIEDKRGT